MMYRIIAIAYERKYGVFSRIVQFAKSVVFSVLYMFIAYLNRYYIYAPSSALFTCPLAMTDGCARVLSMHAARPDIVQHLTTRDPSQFWTSGQWMTERSGGSDVSGTETFATKSTESGSGSNTYLIDGFKWFSSATDSQVTLLLARENAEQKLSCFLGHVKDGGANIIRLKNKLGTKPLPTAELELRNLKSELIGLPERGVSVISSMLAITRIHNSVNAVAFLRRSLEIAKVDAFSFLLRILF